jgi:integrase/recombinase XerD
VVVVFYPNPFNNMIPVVVKPVNYKGTVRMAAYFDYYERVAAIVRKIAGARWSATLKCWHLTLDKPSYEALKSALAGKAAVDDTALRSYLYQKAALPEKVKTVKPPPAASAARAAATRPGPALLKAPALVDAVNAHVLPAMKQALILKAYSAATIKTYLNEMAQFGATIKKHRADDFTADRIRNYLQYCFEKLKLSENTLHSRINALKFYYEQVLHREKFFWEIPRPKKQLQLPHFFSREEVAAIINAIKNSKHKTMLMLAYSCGLRVSEVVGIKVSHIDSKRKCILIKQAKGKKDRMVPLSPVLLVMLREYWMQYKPAGNGLLFKGQYAEAPYSTRSLQLIITAAKKEAGILKEGSIHALRHSFATHLLDKGTDTTMIMKLLGHTDLKTTLRYLHVTNRDILGIVSPLDDLDLA